MYAAQRPNRYAQLRHDLIRSLEIEREACPKLGSSRRRNKKACPYFWGSQREPVSLGCVGGRITSWRGPAHTRPRSVSQHCINKNASPIHENVLL
jgi:hypothetical protein